MKTNILSRLIACAVFGAAILVVGSIQAAQMQVTFAVNGDPVTSITIEDGGGGDTSNPIFTNRIEWNDVIVNEYLFSGGLQLSNTAGENGEAYLTISADITHIDDPGLQASLGMSPIIGTGVEVTVFASAIGFSIPSAPLPISALTSGSIHPLPVSNTLWNFWSSSYTGPSVLATTPAGLDFLDIVGTPITQVNWDDHSTVAGPALVADYGLGVNLSTTFADPGTSVTIAGGVVLTQLPEPASMAIWACLSGVGMVVAARKRRKQNVA